MITQNGTYTFTLKDSDGTTKTATVEIKNIITGDIQIAANPSTPTASNVVVTVVWPSESENGCKDLTSLDLSNFNTSLVGDMSYMFMDCSSLISLDVSNFDTNRVTNMVFMFGGCSSLTKLDLSSFNTSGVTDMRYMFSNCSSLTTIDVSESWSTASVTSGGNMFNNCQKLIGEIGYDSTKTDATYANYTTGYLTLKVELPE